MLQIEVPLAAGADLNDLEAVVERSCQLDDLSQALKGTLASYPGCVHWHYIRRGQRGTLEITWWPAQARLWFKVSAGRAAAWIEPVIPRLEQAILSALRADAPAHTG